MPEAAPAPSAGARAPATHPQPIFDAHLDLAMLGVLGRDMLAPLATCGGPDLPAGVTLRTLRDAGVRRALATIFTEAGGGDHGVGYPEGEAEAAHAAGLLQLAHYKQWRRDGHLDLWDEDRGAPLRVAILMECADPVRTPAEFAWWRDAGVRVVGLAWAKGSRYAGGNSQPGVGLTDLGREAVGVLDELGVVHDVSHLSDASLEALLSRTDRAVIASHSNCRALVDASGTNERHLTDAHVREIARRGGLIGLNLFAPFVSAAGREGRPSVEEAAAHVLRVCDIAGHERSVMLGSDLDGGFSAVRLPAGIGSHADLGLLASALRRGGMSEAGVRGFFWENWERAGLLGDG